VVFPGSYKTTARGYERKSDAGQTSEIIFVAKNCIRRNKSAVRTKIDTIPGRERGREASRERYIRRSRQMSPDHPRLRFIYMQSDKDRSCRI
jgi:hypothetical protein